VNIQLDIVAFPTYQEKFIRDNAVAPFVQTFGCHCHTAEHISRLLNQQNVSTLFAQKQSGLVQNV